MLASNLRTIMRKIKIIIIIIAIVVICNHVASQGDGKDPQNYMSKVTENLSHI